MISTWTLTRRTPGDASAAGRGPSVETALNPNREVSTLDADFRKQPWFVGGVICCALGLAVSAVPVAAAPATDTGGPAQTLVCLDCHDGSAASLAAGPHRVLLGKAGDGWGPLGPWLVSADQIDPQKLELKCIVNGQVRQSSNTSLMIFDCKTLINYISENWELKAGDIIFTGTCEGVISGYPKDKQVWLKPGDKIVTAIQNLGELEFSLT